MQVGKRVRTSAASSAYSSQLTACRVEKGTKKRWNSATTTCLAFFLFIVIIIISPNSNPFRSSTQRRSTTKIHQTQGIIPTLLPSSSSSKDHFTPAVQRTFRLNKTLLLLPFFLTIELPKYIHSHHHAKNDRKIGLLYPIDRKNRPSTISSAQLHHKVCFLQ